MHKVHRIGFFRRPEGLLICAVGLLFSHAASAATLGLNTTSIPNSASAQLLVTVNGTDTNVQGADLAAQINDGGTGNGGFSTKPTITTISMSQAGMLFAGDGALESFQQTNGPLIGFDSIASGSQLSDAGPITLAAITINASAMTPGSTFTIQFSNVGPSLTTSDLKNNSAGTIPLTGTGIGSPATITVTPEPITGSLLLAGLVGLVLRRPRR